MNERNPQNLLEIISKDTKGLGFALHYLTLYSIVIGMEANNVLEFGAGYSTEVILRALDDAGNGHLVSIDRGDHKWDFIEKRLKARLETWRYNFEDIHHIVQNKVYEVCLHDGNHREKEVVADLGVIIPRMKVNGIILLHDTEAGPESLGIQTMKTTNIFSRIPYNLEYCTLPFGCGLTIIRVRHDFGHGKCKLTWSKFGRKKK